MFFILSFCSSVLTNKFTRRASETASESLSFERLGEELPRRTSTAIAEENTEKTRRSSRSARQYHGPPSLEHSDFSDLASRDPRNPSRSNHAFLASEMSSLNDSRPSRPSCRSHSCDRYQRTFDYERVGNACLNCGFNNHDTREVNRRNDRQYRDSNNPFHPDQTYTLHDSSRELSLKSRANTNPFLSNSPFLSANPFLTTDIVPSDTAKDTPPSSNPKNPIACWNCGQLGHRGRKCLQPRRLYCYHCGNPGVIRKNCSCPRKSATK